MSASPSPHLSSLRTEVLPYFPPSSAFSHPALLSSACDLLSSLRRLTAPGRASTRFALDKPDQRTCLAAVASVIACERAQENIVTRRDALKKSGASLRVFEGTLRLCREALQEAGSTVFKPSDQASAAASAQGSGAITTQSLLAGLPRSPASQSRAPATVGSSSSVLCSPTASRNKIASPASSPASKTVGQEQSPSTTTSRASPAKSASKARQGESTTTDAQGSEAPAPSEPADSAQALSSSTATAPRSPRTPTKTRVVDTSAASSSTSPSNHARASPLHRRLMRSRLETPGKATRAMDEQVQDEEDEVEGDLSAPVAGPSRSTNRTSTSTRSTRNRGALARAADNPFDDTATGLDFGDEFGRSRGDLLGSPTRSPAQKRPGKRKRDETLSVACDMPPVSPWCSVKRPPPAFSGPTALLEPADPEGRVFALMPPPPDRSSALASVAEEVYREALVAQEDAAVDGTPSERKDAVKQQRLAVAIERLVEADEEARLRRQRKRIRRSRAVYQGMMSMDGNPGSEGFKIGSEWDRHFGFVRVKDQIKRSRTWVEKLEDVRSTACTLLPSADIFCALSIVLMSTPQC